jgi:hypothetical protein
MTTSKPRAVSIPRVFAALAILVLTALMVGSLFTNGYQLGWTASAVWFVAAVWLLTTWRFVDQQTSDKYLDDRTGFFKSRVPSKFRSPFRRRIVAVTFALVLLGLLAEKFLP